MVALVAPGAVVCVTVVTVVPFRQTSVAPYMSLGAVEGTLTWERKLSKIAEASVVGSGDGEDGSTIARAVIPTQMAPREN